MSRRLNLVPIVIVASVVACGDAAPPLAPEAAATISMNGSATTSCQAVKFNIVNTPISDFIFTGVITGDLEGTSLTQFDPGSISITGNTLAVSGTASWSITGGVISGLSTFQTAVDNRNIRTDRPGSPATVFENKGTHRALSGIAKANLTYKGSFSATPTPQSIADFQGVICP